MCTEQNCIGTCNVRSTDPGKLDVARHEMARLNIDILGIGELKWMGMGKFNPDGQFIYSCGQEPLRRKGVALSIEEWEKQ